MNPDILPTPAVSSYHEYLRRKQKRRWNAFLCGWIGHNFKFLHYHGNHDKVESCTRCALQRTVPIHPAQRPSLWRWGKNDDGTGEGLLLSTLEREVHQDCVVRYKDAYYEVVMLGDEHCDLRDVLSPSRHLREIPLDDVEYSCKNVAEFFEVVAGFKKIDKGNLSKSPRS